MEPEIIILGKIIQTHQDKYHMCHIMWNLEGRKRT
jgi:hypothetical protein